MCAHDASPRSLTEKILERPRLIQRIRYGIADPSRAFLTVFNSTPLERKLAVLLGIPLNGVDPTLACLGTKSGSRKVFREAGVSLPEGSEDIRSEDDLLDALEELRGRRPGISRAVVKLDESFSGEGNAVFRYPSSPGREALRDSLPKLSFGVSTETRASYLGKLAAMGGIVEEHLERSESASPSVQLRIDPRGEVMLISSHDQILGGVSGHVYQGCRFPAADAYRGTPGAARAIGAVLARRGVVSRLGVDFFVGRAPDRPTGSVTPSRSTSASAGRLIRSWPCSS